MWRVDLLGVKAILPGRHHWGRQNVALVYLKGSRDLIHRRVAARREHFMPIALLDSQFATLEEPTPDEHPITVDVGGQPAEIAHEIVCRIAAPRSP